MSIQMNSAASISAMELRKEPGRFLDRVEYRNESFIIERAGRPKAALVPVAEYEAFRRAKAEARGRLWKQTQEVQKKFAKVDPKKIEKQIEQAIATVRGT